MSISPIISSLKQMFDPFLFYFNFILLKIWNCVNSECNYV